MRRSLLGGAECKHTQRLLEDNVGSFWEKETVKSSNGKLEDDLVTQQVPPYPLI